ncbi:TAXI family TRAP transporter solute-binding subunit [Kushneria phosphatilytica]|uniref:TAXI family TRAP transporter solute-binding subunit n=1 Tax=Kushneria phosphatilytica TaxID=657387 RepID=A0A1S1NRR4_9GAMM|nr:TAXI family TRAP transporter solute-binding subunit [Kushneria phosphatilytica]OHV07619.1 hypothetical protein BH688_15550 [Kushneria phosphatilytica]QEL10107.1 TAXI family TRAP transporter solute-binding subunit [Kushneria phosphatilytica]
MYQDDHNAKRRQLLKFGVASAGLLMMPGLSYAAGRPRELKWGSASLGSTGYIIIEALAQAVQRHSDIPTSTLSTSGGAENMALIQRGEIDFGQTTSTDWPVATQGKKPFRAPVDARQVCAYTVWNIPLIVRADSNIRSYADLAGKRIMPSSAGGATAIMYQALLQAAGVADSVDWTYGSWNDTFNAFKSGAVDAIPAVLTNGRASPSLEEINTSTPFRVLPIEQETLDKARGINGGLLKSTVSSEQWKHVEGEMLIPAISGVLAASPDVTDDEAYQVCKAIFDNSEEVRKVGSQLKDVSAGFATRYLLPDYPVNAGAARYFKEKGVWDEQLIIADPVSA